MTGEELERAIDFLLKSQANLEAQSARTDEQLRQLTVRLDAFADIQSNLVRVMTQSIEEHGRIHASLRATSAMQSRVSESLFASDESLRASDESLRAALTELAARQSRTEDALARLADAQASSEQRLESLTKLVEEERKGGR